MFKQATYFVIGVFTGLIVSELMKDAKPIEKIVIYDGYRMRYDYPHYYRFGYDYYYRPLEYRGGGRNQSNTRNDGERRGGTGTTGTSTVKDTPERKKSWGTKY